MAGALIDFSADEVVIGANVKLLDENGAVVREGASDEFGDFMFDQMEPGTYKLVASKEGYQTLEAVANVLLEDLNLGDLAFESAKSPRAAGLAKLHSMSKEPSRFLGRALWWLRPWL